MIRIIGWILLCLPAVAQEQPIEFPHDKHVRIGLECIDCHSLVDSRARASLPSVRKCMLCHEKVATTGPGVTVLREFAAKKRELPWERVYQFNESAHVVFRYAPHIRANVSCEKCHGEVRNMTVVHKVVNHTMGSCVSCHRENQATDDCAACHF